MSDYTPTTSDIYQTYVAGCRASKLRPQRHPDEDSDSRERFDRWLTDVKAQAWEEGYNAKWAETWFEDNPYRQGEN